MLQLRLRKQKYARSERQNPTWIRSVVSSESHEAHIYTFGKLKMDLDEGLRMLTLGTPELVKFGEWLDESSASAASAFLGRICHSVVGRAPERIFSFGACDEHGILAAWKFLVRSNIFAPFPVVEDLPPLISMPLAFFDDV